MCVCSSRARLNLPLFPPIRVLANACKQNIVASLWPSNQALSASIDEFDSYFEYYNQCRNRDPVDPVEQTQLEIVDFVILLNISTATSTALCSTRAIASSVLVLDFLTTSHSFPTRLSSPFDHGS